MRPLEILTWSELDTRSLRIYREEAQLKAKTARGDQAIAVKANYPWIASALANDAEQWEARQAEIEAELTHRNLQFD